MLIGLQASGKSTFYRVRFQDTHTHVSNDNFQNNRNKERRTEALISRSLAEGRSVVVDNTHPSRASRRPVIESARAHGARVIGYYFESRVDACLSRNEARDAASRVPPVAIYSTVNALEHPSLDEGFDELWFVRWTSVERYEIEPWKTPPPPHPE
jgi:predicted kinase